MTVRHHLHLWYLGTTFWTLFYLAGLPSGYYQRWPWIQSLILIVLAPTLLLWVLGRRLLARDFASVRWPHANLWFAFYMTVPFATYDAWVLGWYEARGWYFVVSHWYLSVFYIIPWLVLWPIGRPSDHSAAPPMAPL